MRGDGVVARRTSLFVGIALAILGGATMASAQGMPSPPPPPPAAAPAEQPSSPTGAPPAPDAMTPAPPPPMGAPPSKDAAGYPPPGYPPAMVFGPSRLPYNESDPIPPGYEVQTRPRMGMAKAGIATFVPFYGLSVLFGGVYLGSEGGEAKMYFPLLIPVVGPFATMGTAGTEEFGTMILAINGIGQLTGAALFIAGMLSEEKYLARRSAGLRPEVFVGPQSMALRWQF